MNALASVIVVSFNHRDDLSVCIPSLLRQTYSPIEIVLVDNASDDGTPAYVAERFPQVRVVRNASNVGFARANNIGFGLAAGSVLICLNPDTEVDPSFVEELVHGMESNPGAGLATSRVCHFDARDIVNTCGNDVHVSGVAFCRGLDTPARRWDHPDTVASVSGAAFAIRRSVLEEIGGFDDDFFMYAEDTDLSLRAQVAGYDIAYIPGSIVYHKYSLRMRPDKYHLLERNRLLTLVKNLRFSTLAALLPVVLATELTTWAYAAGRGPAYLAAKARAYSWIGAHRGVVLAKHREVQRLRRRGDARLLRLLRRRLPAGQFFGSGRVARSLSALTGPVFAVAAAPAVALCWAEARLSGEGRGRAAAMESTASRS